MTSLYGIKKKLDMVRDFDNQNHFAFSLGVSQWIKTNLKSVSRLARTEKVKQNKLVRHE